MWTICPGRQSSQGFRLEGIGKAPEGAGRQNHPKFGRESRQASFGVPTAFHTPEPRGCSPLAGPCTSVCTVEGGRWYLPQMGLSAFSGDK